MVIVNKLHRKKVVGRWSVDRKDVGTDTGACAASALGDFILIETGKLETPSALVPISAAENLDQFEILYLYAPVASKTYKMLT